MSENISLAIKNNVTKSSKWVSFLYLLNALIFSLLLTSNYGLSNALYFTSVLLLAIFAIENNWLKTSFILGLTIFSLFKIPFLMIITILSVKTLIIMFLMENSLSTTFWVLFPVLCLLPVYGVFITSLGVAFGKQHIKIKMKYPKVIIVLLLIIPNILPFESSIPKQNEIINDIYLEVVDVGISLTDMEAKEKTLALALIEGIEKRNPGLIRDGLINFTVKEKIFLVKDKAIGLINNNKDKIKEKGVEFINKFKREEN